MYRKFAVAVAMASSPILVAGTSASAQISTPATPRVGGAAPREQIGPPAPPADANLPLLTPRAGPLPSTLTLQQALEEAEARSPAIIAAQSRLAAAEARVRQAGFRANPELSIEVENFLGTGELSGFRGVETTVAVNQRLDLGGRRSARVASARAEVAAEQLRLAIARADLIQSVRGQFARAVTAHARYDIAIDNERRARELARVAGILVQEGRDPPLRAIRARSAAAQALADLEAARAEERAARQTLGSLFGVSTPPEQLTGGLVDWQRRTVDAEQTLEVRLAEAERLRAEAALRQEQVANRLDPAVGLGVRHVKQTGDFALVAGVSVPIPIFDRNQGNIAAAQANIRAAEAGLASARAAATARVRNAEVNLEAATARVEALARAAVPEGAEAMRLAEISYREGRATLLELLDAQNAYRTAQLALVDARSAQALAAAELGRVTAQ